MGARIEIYSSDTRIYIVKFGYGARKNNKISYKNVGGSSTYRADNR